LRSSRGLYGAGLSSVKATGRIVRPRTAGGMGVPGGTAREVADAARRPRRRGGCGTVGAAESPTNQLRTVKIGWSWRGVLWRNCRGTVPFGQCHSRPFWAILSSWHKNSFGCEPGSGGLGSRANSHRITRPAGEKRLTGRRGDGPSGVLLGAALSGMTCCAWCPQGRRLCVVAEANTRGRPAPPARLARVSPRCPVWPGDPRRCTSTAWSAT
jgi:hypothetical protein